MEILGVGESGTAILDNNISNCEKVSGTIHFGIGHLKEWSHIDQIVEKTTVVSTNAKGEKTYIIDKGILQF